MSFLKRGTSVWKVVTGGSIAVFVVSLLCADLFRVRQSSASVLDYLPSPGEMVTVGKRTSVPLLRGVRVVEDDGMSLEFLFDTAGLDLHPGALRRESERVIRYFLAALTTPEKDLWVNLSPYESDRIIPDALGQTDLGRDMLGEDYLLKQLASSLTHPDTPTGEAYWRVENGKSTIENRLGKIWIVPDKAEVYENGTTAVITEASLKLQCEDRAQRVLLPAITKDVNEGSNFARLRQMYYSLVLALWFKARLRESVLGRLYADRRIVRGIDIDDPTIAGKIYEQYLESFRKGVYDVLRAVDSELTAPNARRRFFSGGVDYTKAGSAVVFRNMRRYPESVVSANLKKIVLDMSSGTSSAIADKQDFSRRIEEGLRSYFRLNDGFYSTKLSSGFNDPRFSGLNETRFAEIADKLSRHIPVALDFSGFENEQWGRLSEMYKAIDSVIMNICRKTSWLANSDMMRIEMLKNAFVHGNRLQTGVPVVMYIDHENMFHVIDGALPENMLDPVAFEASRGILHGHGQGNRETVVKFQEDPRMGNLEYYYDSVAGADRQTLCGVTGFRGSAVGNAEEESIVAAIWNELRDGLKWRTWQLRQKLRGLPYDLDRHEYEDLKRQGKLSEKVTDETNSSSSVRSLVLVTSLAMLAGCSSRQVLRTPIVTTPPVRELTQTVAAPEAEEKPALPWYNRKAAVDSVARAWLAADFSGDAHLPELPPQYRNALFLRDVLARERELLSGDSTTGSFNEPADFQVDTNVLELAHSARAADEQADRYIDSGDPERAFRLILQSNPYITDERSFLNNVPNKLYLKAKRWYHDNSQLLTDMRREFLQEFRDLETAVPDSSYDYFTYAMIARNLGDKQLALEYLRRYLATHDELSGFSIYDTAVKAYRELSVELGDGDAYRLDDGTAGVYVNDLSHTADSSDMSYTLQAEGIPDKAQPSAADDNLAYARNEVKAGNILAAKEFYEKVIADALSSTYGEQDYFDAAVELAALYRAEGYRSDERRVLESVIKYADVDKNENMLSRRIYTLLIDNYRAAGEIDKAGFLQGQLSANLESETSGSALTPGGIDFDPSRIGLSVEGNGSSSITVAPDMLSFSYRVVSIEDVKNLEEEWQI